MGTYRGIKWGKLEIRQAETQQDITIVQNMLEKGISRLYFKAKSIG